LALLVAPLVLVLAGRGLTEFTVATTTSRGDPLATAVALAALVVAGLLFAGLVLPPFLSPLGPLIAGLSYRPFGAAILFGSTDLLGRLAAEGIRLDHAQVTAAAGTAVLLALPLLLTVFSRHRWRGRPDAVGAVSWQHRPLPDTEEMPTIPLH